MKRDIDKYNQARKMRQAGESIRRISQLLHISSSSASIWTRNVELSEMQKTRLAKRGNSAEQLRKFANERHEAKIQNSKKVFDESKNEIKKLKENELFLVGLALYWAEGFKNKQEQRVGFCNSDPRMINFIMKWFRETLKISDENFTLRAEFNQIHKNRQDEIENYWSVLTNIPKSQFNRPYLQKTKWNRDYSKRDKYCGLLRIRIRKSSQLLIKFRGWIEGLALNNS